MIKNERQYRISKASLARFEQSLKQLKAQPPQPKVHPRLQQAQLDAMQSEIEVLREQITTFEQLRQGQKPLEVNLGVLEALPRALVQARIAAGLTQKDLAMKLGLKEQQVQRYEATDYAQASLRRVREVVAILSAKEPIKTGSRNEWRQ